MTDWLLNQHPVIQAAIRALCVIVPILTLVPGCIWLERRLLSWMQDRIGPNRVGPFGLLQPIADGIKLFMKEDITPTTVDRLLFFLSPAIALFPAFTLAATLPWGPLEGPLSHWHPVADVNVGVLYMLAISSLGVYGVVLAGYASNNKYSLMGGLRASAQLISYELAMGVSLAGIVMATGSLKMTEMIKVQMEPLWGVVPQIQNWFIFTPFGLVSAAIFFVCMIAETNRVPFDLPEAENELIAGYHTEYSSMKFAVFFMGEYAAMFVFSGVFATVFLGGYNPLPLNWQALGMGDSIGHWIQMFAPVFFIGKCAFGMATYIWLRATLPRLRYDQLMSLGWKSLLPAAVGNFIVVAIWILCTKLYGPAGGWISAGASFFLLFVVYKVAAAMTKKGVKALAPRSVRMVDGTSEAAS